MPLACGLPSLLPYLYFFWKEDIKNDYYLHDPEYYRRQEIQRLIYKLNQPYLRITQTAFTNVSIMDRPYLTELFGGRQFPNGEFMIDYIEEIIEFQKIFMEVVAEIRKEKMMTYPVFTYSLLYQNGKFVDEDFARWCSDRNYYWMDSNFYIGEDVTSLSSCCRLVNDFSKLDGFSNSIGGTGLKIGSVKVNTINLMRVALESDKNIDKFMDVLTGRTNLCIKTLDVIRHIIERNIEKGLLPNYHPDIIEMKNQFNTIGINAMYEVIDYFGEVKVDDFGNKSYTERGVAFASAIMDKINAIKDSYNFDYSINVEAVPGEKCAVILCQKDNLLFREQEKDKPFIYSNQWIPLMERCTIQEKLKLGAILDRKCGGGQISHINVDAPFPNTDVAWEMLNKIAQSGVIYFAFNSKISVCKNTHGFYGDVCPICNEPKVDTYQRIVGFLTPSQAYSKDRKKEFNLRDWHTLSELKEI